MTDLFRAVLLQRAVEKSKQQLLDGIEGVIHKLASDADILGSKRVFDVFKTCYEREKAVIENDVSALSNDGWTNFVNLLDNSIYRIDTKLFKKNSDKIRVIRLQDSMEYLANCWKHIPSEHKAIIAQSGITFDRSVGVSARSFVMGFMRATTPFELNTTITSVQEMMNSDIPVMQRLAGNT